MAMPDLADNTAAAAKEQLATGLAPWRRIVPSHLFGCINGTIGVVAPLDQEQYRFLRRLEDQLESLIYGAGGLSHREWRAFCNDRKYEESSQGFIDGDLIEGFLDLPAQRKQKVAAALQLSVEAITERVEQAQRIH